MKWILTLTALIITVIFPSSAFTEGPPEQRIKAAYQMILSQADSNRDGKLSLEECMAIYKDKIVAEKNCTFWDVNKDGIVTEAEYIMQGSNLGKKQ
ncbi:MAG: hypothetical protein V2B20_18475 [Pseudomonadota bacterium]